jgi:hypothetical protein
MKLIIEINLDNAAFNPDPQDEVQRILKQYLSRIEMGIPSNMNLRDINGNTVGFAIVVDN